VLGDLLDARLHDGDLDLRGSRIAFVARVFCDDCLFLGLAQRHIGCCEASIVSGPRNSRAPAGPLDAALRNPPREVPNNGKQQALPKFK
jgi:hypothetical protein